ncbi:MAG: hypothetical protein WHS88_00360 [Anaerohalosphaeraceae bacterium]
MKPRTGLHKKVSFIFDGVPTPPAAPAASAGPTPSVGTAGSNTYTPQPLPASAPAARPAGPKDTRTSAAKNRKKSKKDARQTQMQILVGVLSLVLIATLFFVMRTPAAPPKKAAASVSSPAAEPAASEPAKWVRPEPWPERMRDPMAPDTAGQTPDTGSDALLVRGIVFSQTNPSAIIGNQIVFIGDTLNGIRVVNITRDTVEFEKDGKRWTQTVQP